MPSPSERQFTALFRALDSADRRAFVADLWAARGWETTIEETSVIASREDIRRELSIEEIDPAELEQILLYGVDRDIADQLVERYIGGSIDDLAESATRQTTPERSSEQANERRSSEQANERRSSEQANERRSSGDPVSRYRQSIRTGEAVPTTGEGSDEVISTTDSSSSRRLNRRQMLVLGSVFLLAVAVVLVVPVGPDPIVDNGTDSGGELSTTDREGESESETSFGGDGNGGVHDAEAEQHTEASDDPDGSEVTITLAPHDRQDDSNDRDQETPGSTSGPAPGVFLTGIDDPERMATEHAIATRETDSMRFRAWIDILTEANQSIDRTEEAVVPGMAIDSGTVVANVESNDTIRLRDDTGLVLATERSDTEFGLDLIENADGGANGSVESIELFADGERQLTRITNTAGVRYKSQAIADDDRSKAAVGRLGGTLVRTYLDVNESEVTQLIRNGEVYYRIDTATPPVALEGAVSEYRATAIQDPDGVVHELAVVYGHEPSDSAVRIGFEYDRFDNATVEPPAWYDLRIEE